MKPLSESVRRLPVTIVPDQHRVLLRPFLPSLIVKPLAHPEPNQRVLQVFARVMTLGEAEVQSLLAAVMADFDSRHKYVREIFLERFEHVRPMLPVDREFTRERQLLLGAYFTNEYSLESAALFNPSMVPHPDQAGVPAGSLRFVMSLRATGEGHISSITFRSGTLDAGCEVTMDAASRFVHMPKPDLDSVYERPLFGRKLYELGISTPIIEDVLGDLPENFTFERLVARVRKLRVSSMDETTLRAADRALTLAQSNYRTAFSASTDISERILFPFAPSESNGIEDARFVLFQDDERGPVYYATYTAYDGKMVLPQLVETRDFLSFEACTLNGPAVSNKGFALFPRKIRGLYAMLGRQDSENIHVMFSEHLHFWHESRVIVRPAQPWEFVQLGNCGSPIETERGWLVLTHGVGPMRRYAIGAVLLDLEQPEKILARLREPLLAPAADEREGYVPNVVYSCGGLLHAGHLVLPYAVSDYSSRIATVPLEDLLDAMR